MTKTNVLLQQSDNISTEDLINQAMSEIGVAMSLEDLKVLSSDQCFRVLHSQGGIDTSYPARWLYAFTLWVGFILFLWMLDYQMKPGNLRASTSLSWVFCSLGWSSWPMTAPLKSEWSLCNFPRFEGDMFLSVCWQIYYVSIYMCSV